MMMDVDGIPYTYIYVYVQLARGTLPQQPPTNEHKKSTTAQHTEQKNKHREQKIHNTQIKY